MATTTIKLDRELRDHLDKFALAYKELDGLEIAHRSLAEMRHIVKTDEPAKYMLGILFRDLDNMLDLGNLSKCPMQYNPYTGILQITTKED